MEQYAAAAGLVISLVSLAMAGYSLRLHYLRWKRDKQNSEPIVTARIADGREPRQGWIVARIKLRNRQNIAVSMTRIAVIWPPSARILQEHRVRTRDGFGGATTTIDFDKSRARRALETSMSVREAGREGRLSAGAYQVGDTHSEEFLFRVSPSIADRMASIFSSRSSYSSRRIVMRVFIESEDEKSLHKKRVMLRNVMPHVKEAQVTAKGMAN